MLVIYILSSTLITRGLEYACAAAVCGIFAGELLSFLFVILAYKGFKVKHSFIKRPSISSAKAWGLLFSMALPLTFNRIIGSLLSTFENTLLPQKLMAFGMTNSQAVSEFGKISGMAMPLIMFPSAMLVSLATSLVPAVSENMAMGNYKRINATVSKVLLFTTITGIGASGLFILLSNELGMVIYNEDIGHLLMMLGIMCPLMYMHTTLSGILNGLGEQMFIFRNSLISSAISIGSVFLIVPRYGIDGYILGNFTSLLVICFLSINKIKAVAKINIEFVRLFVKPVLCIVLACLTTNLVKGKIFNSTGNVLGLIASTLILSAIYVFFIVATGCFGIKDIKEMVNRRK